MGGEVGDGGRQRRGAGRPALHRKRETCGAKAAGRAALTEKGWRGRPRSASAPNPSDRVPTQDRSLLAHPDVPCHRPGFLIGHWAARHFERQLHLTVMVALVPEHVLEQEDRMVVVKVHVPACLHPALYRVPHRFDAGVQHLRDATWITLAYPLFFGKISRELGSVLENAHKSYKVDV